MVKYENTTSITDDQRLLCTNLELGIQQAIRNALSKAEWGRSLSVSSYIRVVDWFGEKVKLEANHGVSIRGSYEVSASVNDYIQKRELPTFDNKLSIIVHLIYSNKNEGASSQSSDSKEKEPEVRFTPTKPRYTFEQLILSNAVKEEIMSALNVIKSQNLIYKEWGFEEIDSVPRSILNFYGAPGTGKTMCAHAIASYLKRPLLALNYSEIESKYVGEAAKNLANAFKQAKEENAILFFDEADSFLGKRLENVTNGSDQALNSLRSQMLILLEEFSGVVIFATNLVTNFDTAFESRILKHIRFELPNREARAEIIRSKIPAKLPKSDVWDSSLFLKASDQIEGLSGREIKSAVLEMMLSKANKDGSKAVFSADDLVSAMKNKKESIEKLKAEEKERIKQKIMKKISEKAEENKMENKMEEEQKKAAEKSATSSEEADITTIDYCKKE